MKAKWSEIVESLQKAIQVSIPRHYSPSGDSSDKTQAIHTFADASLRAVVYIQQGDCITFLIAKTRVASLSKLTLPKLELMEALVATRLTKFAVNSLGECCRDMPIHLWSDSQIVLYWISSKKQLKQQFVSHRIQEITQAFPSKMWNYCPTGDNPADLLTRGTNSEVLHDSLWMHGPSWLSEKSRWPQWKQNEAEILHLQTEGDIKEANNSEPTSVEATSLTGLHKILLISSYSSLARLLRITSYVLRFVHNIRNPNVQLKGVLSNEESLAKWIYNCQQTCFHQEFKQLKSKAAKHLPLIRQLRLFLDKNNFIRCATTRHLVR